MTTLQVTEESKNFSAGYIEGRSDGFIESVRECANWIVDNASSMDQLGPEYFAKAMKQHFGIE